jgi:hypothetical protein
MLTILVGAFLLTANRRSATAKQTPSRPVQAGKVPDIYPVTIQAAPEDAKVVIDNVEISSKSPSLPAGSHVMSVSAPGYVPQIARFLAVKGAAPIVVNLKRQPLSIAVNARVDWGTVALDGGEPQALDAGSIEIANSLAGAHTLEFSAQRMKAKLTFDYQPGRLVAISNIDSTSEIAVLTASSDSGRTRLFCNCIPTMIAIDGHMQNLSANGIELELPPGQHKFEVGSLSGKAQNFEIKSQPSLIVAVLQVNPKTVLTKTQEKTTADPNKALDDVRRLIAGKRFVEASSKLGKVLASAPENEVALRLRKDLETLRRLDPENWK